MRLTYFAGPGGRAEPARLALSAAGIEFEDVRVNGPEEWAARKPTTPSGALPLLEVGQTTASLPPSPIITGFWHYATPQPLFCPR